MRWNRVTIVTAIALILLLSFFGWRWLWPPFENDELAASQFSSPTEITPGLVKNFALTINGVNWFDERPVVESGSRAKLTAKWVGDRADWMGGGSSEASGPSLIIAILLRSNPDFSRRDAFATPMIFVPWRQPSTKKFHVNLAPGDYVVRIFQQRDFHDNQGLLDRVETDLIAETGLSITTPKDGAPSTHVPFDTKNAIVPTFPTTYGNLDPRR